MHFVFATITAILAEIWALLTDASLYILIGLLAGGMLKMFLSPGYVAAHLGSGRFSSVVKAALLGIPLPLCSCGVLPAAVSLKKQGASNGATTAFLIATPESGVDSIAVSWVLLDPLMTLFRPIAALLTALVAGVSENLLHPPSSLSASGAAGLNMIAGVETERRPEGFAGRLRTGVRYALVELWGDLAGSFFFGLFFAGIVAVLIPDDFFQAYLGGGLFSMLVMLLFGIPLYICATASTPIAAAFILKGVSPGAALVFLLAGPATNIATIFVLSRLLGKRSMILYLAAIAVVSVFCGLALDLIYEVLGISAQAVVGRAGEITPVWLRLGATLLILLLSVRPLARSAGKFFRREAQGCDCPAPPSFSLSGTKGPDCTATCGCSVPSSPDRTGKRQELDPEKRSADDRP